RYPEDHLLTVLAKDCEIPCITTVLNWDAVSTKIMPPATSQAYLVWGPQMAEEMEEYYRITGARGETIQTGSPQYDVFASYRRGEVNVSATSRAMNLDPARPVVLYGCSTPRNVPKEHILVRDLVSVARRKLGHQVQ